jgi:FMN phosphatase YigB (HAD superfamily)
LSHTGFRSEDAAYVGDRIDNDILPAQAAGMRGIFVERGPWGRIHAQRGDAARADVRVHALLELAETLAR